MLCVVSLVSTGRVMCVVGPVNVVVVAVERENSTSCEDRWDGDVGNVVGFYNMFGGDARVFDGIVGEQVSALSGVMDRIHAVNMVYFGDGYETFSVAGGKYILSNQSAPNGNEHTTLQLLYTHCLAHPKDRAFYIHTKGSFHAHAANDALRRNHMHAVAGCIGMDGVANADVCGLRVSPLPHPHYPGNMWVARCAYVGRLRAPMEFEGLMGAFAKPDCPDWSVGKDRYSAEHWILSHPSAVAADVLPSYTGLDPPYYTWGYAGLPSHAVWPLVVERFPRKGLAAKWFLASDPNYQMACSMQSYRLAEYVYLFGPVNSTLPCGSLYLQWHALALAEFGGVGARLGDFVADMRSHSMQK
jgi:hypothetical protein